MTCTSQEIFPTGEEDRHGEGDEGWGTWRERLDEEPRMENKDEYEELEDLVEFRRFWVEV